MFIMVDNLHWPTAGRSLSCREMANITLYLFRLVGLSIPGWGARTLSVIRANTFVKGVDFGQIVLRI